MAEKTPEQIDELVNRISGKLAGYCGADDDPESDISDAMADLLHWAASLGLDPETLLNRALRHYEDERC